MVKEFLYRAIAPRPFVAPRGRKPVFLPNFTLTLLNTPRLPPTMAKFLVPLDLNKLDLKDYLYHAYNIPVLAVRSYITQQKIRQGKMSDKWFKQRQWSRPRAIKHMIVEMKDPFVWPEETRDLQEWDQKSFKGAQEAQEQYSLERQLQQRAVRTDQRTLREQAQALLEGREKWKPSWETFKPKTGQVFKRSGEKL